MKSTLKLLSASLAFASLQALADPMYYDVGAVGGPSSGDPNTLSDVFSQLEFYSQVTTQHFDSDGSGGLSVGDTISSSANGAVLGLSPAGDSELVTSLAEITFNASSVTGAVSSIVAGNAGSSIVTTQFDAASVFSFFYEFPRNQDFGADISTSDDSGFGDGSLVMNFVLDTDSSQLVETFNAQGLLISASYTLVGVIDFALDGFWSFAGLDGVAGTDDDQDVTGLLDDYQLIIEITGESLRVATEESFLARTCRQRRLSGAITASELRACRDSMDLIAAAGDPLPTTHFDWQPLLTGAIGDPLPPNPTPEPRGLWLIVLGGAALLYARRRVPVRA